MVKAIDVADYILEKSSMSAVKLQKLLYYALAWHLVWEDEELFKEEIQAWANGPVIPFLYAMHRKRFKLAKGFFKGIPSNLSARNKEIVDKVIDYYGNKDTEWLNELTHMEEPWKKARKDLIDGERGNSVITAASMSEYYSGL